MIKVKISKKDVAWSYIAQFLNLGVGLITLPAILKLLNSDEVGLNYILVSINSVVSLFDMGFSSQIGKNITYVLSGAQTIEKEGISADYYDNINENLLSCVLATAKNIYKRISILAMIPLLTLGTYYIWSVTDCGSSINHLSAIWVIFCLSCFFNLYFLYYNSFLQGRGLIKEAKQGQILSKIIQIVVMIVMLLCGFGLLSVVVSNLIAPFAFRIFANKKFYDSYIKAVIRNHPVTSNDINKTFKILFFNAKKMGIIGILAAALGYASTLIVGAFLPLSVVGSYGVMIQLLGIIAGLSTLFFYSITPELSQYIVKKQIKQLKQSFGLSLFVFFILQILGFVGLLIAPLLFQLFDFETELPSRIIIILFFIYKFFELVQSLYSQLLLIGNNMIFYKSAIWTGIISIFLQVCFLYSGLGLYGILLAYIVPLFAYNAWKWPIYTTKMFGINFKNDVFQHSIEVINENIFKFYNRQR